MARSTFQTIRDLVVGNPIGMFITTVLSVSTIQWALQRFMATWCHTAGFWGFITNPVNLGSPVCLAANNIQLALANHYVGIWAGAATFCAAWFVQRLASPVPASGQKLGRE